MAKKKVEKKKKEVKDLPISMDFWIPIRTEGKVENKKICKDLDILSSESNEKWQDICGVAFAEAANLGTKVKEITFDYSPSQTCVRVRLTPVS